MNFGANRSMEDEEPTDVTDTTDWSRFNQIKKITQNVNRIQQLINQLQSSNVTEVKQHASQLADKSLKELAQLQQASNLAERAPNTSYFSRRMPSYYDSRPVFGGSSSRAARLAGTTPYNLSQRSFAPTLRVNVNPTKRVLVSNDPLSTSSKRILEKLEKASTPLQDAKRIPQNASLRDYFQTSDLLHRSSKRPKLGPPVHATPVATPTIANNTFHTNPKRWELKLVTDKEVNKPMESTDQIIDSCDNKYVNDINEFKSKESFGGKITRKDQKREEKKVKPHFPRETEDTDNLDLLTNSQPLTMPSSLPIFSFGVSSVPKPSTTITKSLENNTEFTFAEPVLKKRTEKRKTENDDSFGVNKEKPFVFSSPLSAITPNVMNGLEKQPKDNGTVIKVTPGWGDKFKPKLGSWTCSECLVTNDSDKTSCVACETPKPVPKPTCNNNISLTDKMSTADTNKTQSKPELLNDKWICYCLYQNSNCDSKCMACAKPRFTIMSEPSQPCLPPAKPSSNDEIKVTSNGSVAPITGWGDKFKPKTGSWNCSSCLITNDADKTKCAACEQPKPESKLSAKTKSLSDSWQCFYCKDTNNSSTVCKSCDKIKTPIATKSDLDKLYNQPFKFGFSLQNSGTKEGTDKSQPNDEKSEQSTLLFKSSESISVPTTSNTTSNSFVFGSSAFKDSSKTTAFNITPSATTTTTMAASSLASETFKFGFSAASQKSTDNPNSTTAEVFGSSKASTPVVFGFGTPASGTSSSTGPKPTFSSSSEPNTTSSLFLFGAQNKNQDSNKTTKTVSFELKDKTAEEVSDPKQLGFQYGKTSSESAAPTFKRFSPSSIFSSASSVSPAVTTVTSFLDNKFSTSTDSETQNKSIGFLFGMPTTTSSSIASFSSPFSITSTSAPITTTTTSTTTTTTSVQLSSDKNTPKNMFSFSSSGTSKPFASLVGNALVTTSSLTPNSTLSSTTSSSMPNGLVFGTSNTTIPSFSLPTTTATTKANFTFNMSATTSAPSATTENTFGTSNSLFSTNTNKGFTFGNSSLNNNQMPSFQSPFNPTSSNTSSTTAPNLGFGLKTTSNFTVPSDTSSKPVTNQLFSFGAQPSDQFSNSAPKPLNNISTNPKNDSQFSFGLQSNTSTGQPNSTPSLFGNAVSAHQTNSLSFNPLAPTSSVSSASPFAFGTGFNSNAGATQLSVQPSTQQSAAPQFNFNAQPTFNFGSGGGTGAPFQFTAEQNAGQSVVLPPNRNIKKAKRRLNPT